MAELVTIAEFQNVNDAYILKTRIESEGIRVFLQDENVNNILSAFSFASVKLQVSLNDSFRVMDILYEEN